MSLAILEDFLEILTKTRHNKPKPYACQAAKRDLLVDDGENHGGQAWLAGLRRLWFPDLHLWLVALDLEGDVDGVLLHLDPSSFFEPWPLAPYLEGDLDCVWLQLDPSALVEPWPLVALDRQSNLEGVLLQLDPFALFEPWPVLALDLEGDLDGVLLQLDPYSALLEAWAQVALQSWAAVAAISLTCTQRSLARSRSMGPQAAWRAGRCPG